ncbi:MAG: hypothetical protein M1813_009249 [Trichoglossum hirsutum]|nr:MAG: hypothetical protein M1813_009249 [Trichoglossum hirsutum]
MNLGDLPIELLELIISFAVRDNWVYYSEEQLVLNLRLVCKLFNNLVLHYAFQKLDIEARDIDGTTLLSLVIRKGNEAIVKLLLEKGAMLESKDQAGRTPLWWAAANGHEAIVKLLLEKGAELNSKSYYGETPLLRAAANGHETIAKLLLRKVLSWTQGTTMV